MEKKIAFLKDVSGHTYDTLYDLIFTTERMLALIVWHPGDVPVKFGMMEMFIGGQFAKRNERAARVGLMQGRRTLHDNKRLDELIGLHRLNFEIPYGSIASAEVKRGLLRSYLELRVIGGSRSERTIRFTLTKGQHGEARAIVAEVMAARQRSNDTLTRAASTADVTP